MYTRQQYYLRWVNVLSLRAFKKPRFIKIFNWFNGLVASNAPLSFELVDNGYIFRKSSSFNINEGSFSHCVQSPLSIRCTIKLILSCPYSPHANSITKNKTNWTFEWKNTKNFNDWTLNTMNKLNCVNNWEHYRVICFLDGTLKVQC